MLLDYQFYTTYNDGEHSTFILFYIKVRNKFIKPLHNQHLFLRPEKVSINFEMKKKVSVSILLFVLCLFSSF